MYKANKYISIILALSLIESLVAPPGARAYTNLRPPAAARQNASLPVALYASGTRQKTSSGGADILHGNARVNRTVTGYAAFVRRDGEDMVLTFPVWAEDLERERARFQDIMGILRVELRELRAQGMPGRQDIQDIYNEAERILNKHIEQITRYMDAAGKDSAQDSIAPILDKNPEVLLMDLLGHDLNTYAELKRHVSYKAVAILQQLLMAEAVGGETLVTYADPHNPTEQELSQIRERAEQEYSRFLRIMQREQSILARQIDAQDHTIDVSLRKIIAMLGMNFSKHTPQLEQLADAVAALYAAGDGDREEKRVRETQRALMHALRNMQTLSQHQLIVLKPAEVLNLPDARAKALIGSFNSELAAAQGTLANAWAVFLQITNPALNAYTKPALLARMERITGNMRMASDAAASIYNAIQAKTVMEPFKMVLEETVDAFNANALQQANMPADRMLEHGHRYVFMKNKLAEALPDDADSAAIHRRNMYKDVVGAIQHIIRLIKEETKKQRQPQLSARPLILCLPEIIDPNKFNAFAKTYNIAVVITTAGTTTEHLPLTAAGLGIPYVRVTSEGADLRQLIEDGQALVVHASSQQGKSSVILRPSQQDTQKARVERRHQRLIDAYQRKRAADPVRTNYYFEGTRSLNVSIDVLANGANSDEIADAHTVIAGGIGLFRSEFLPSIDRDSNAQYVDEFQSSLQPDSPVTEVMSRLHRALFFYDMRVEILEVLQAADTDKPFLFRTLDLKKQEKGLGFLNLLSKNQQGENFEDNQIPVRQDLLTLQMEALLDALFVLRAQGNMLEVKPMFPEVNHPDQIRWFFKEVLPNAVNNYKSRLAHELRIDSLTGTKHERAIDGIIHEMRFAVMAERLGIDEAIEAILEEFPIDTVSIGTNDFTEDLLRDMLKEYGVPVSRRDPHFEERFFILEPLVLRKIIVLADKLAVHNAAHPAATVRMGVCGDIASRPEFALFMLWLKERYKDTLDVYISVPANQVLGQKDFIRLVDPVKDFYVGGDSGLGGIFDSLLSEQHAHDLAVETLAVSRVKVIIRRGEQRADYISEVTKPLAAYMAQVPDVDAKNAESRPSSAGTLNIMAPSLDKAIASSA